MKSRWLYRGECVGQQRVDHAKTEAEKDVARRRIGFLKQFHDTGAGLFTKLSDKGDPYELITLGLAKASQLHVGFGRSSINFLSFTECEDTAKFDYAHMPKEPNGLRAMAEYEDAKEAWSATDYVIFKLCIDDLKPRTKSDGALAPGFYEIEYAPGYPAFVINATEFLEALPAELRREPDYSDALFRARRDREWLVMPADTISKGTFSSLLRKCDNLVAVHFVPEDYVTDDGGSAGFLG